MSSVQPLLVGPGGQYQSVSCHFRIIQIARIRWQTIINFAMNIADCTIETLSFSLQHIGIVVGIYVGDGDDGETPHLAEVMG